MTILIVLNNKKKYYSKINQPLPRILLTVQLHEEIACHILKINYDEIFKALLKRKKRKQLNEILTLSLNISLLPIETISEIHLAILRSEFVPEIIMLQETRGAKVNIPGYNRHDGNFINFITMKILSQQLHLIKNSM